MRVPLPWLREYCDPDLDVQAIEQRLTMTGTKVEAIHHHGAPSAEHFVLGRVLSAELHPDADRLRVCSVELGLPEGPATIVCGAPNVAAGQTVAVARPGAVMPDGAKLGKAKLRGVVSEGMILAESELDIDLSPPTRAGIMVLDGASIDGELAPGTPLQEVLPISMDVLELEITPNRPDCLGVYGVARELHAATGAALAPAPWGEDPGSPGPLAASGGVAPATVEVCCPELCPRFTVRVFEHITMAPSPPWLKARLSAAGQRPINNVVDITNYAMLLTGQPLHAFDLDRVAGARLTVRRAVDGERVETLDGQTRTLDGEMVVIEDAEGPTSIAGLMGGARSEVGDTTTRVLLEVANWHGPAIHRASWALGLRSEASGRFEKGLAPEQCLHAQAVASRLMIELCGATLVPGTIDIGAGGEWAPQAPRTIRLRERRVRAILGVSVAAARQAEILEALDFATTHREDGLDVTVPALRREDVTREVDLIEEVARIDGLERLPATLPARRGAAGRLTHAQRVRRARRGCARRARAERDRRLELRRPAAARPAFDPARARAAQGRDGRQPAVGQPIDDAPHAARLAARRRPAQPLARAFRNRDLRVGHRLPGRGWCAFCRREPHRHAGRRRAPSRRAPRAWGAAQRAHHAPRLAGGARAGGLLRRQGAARRATRPLPRALVGGVSRLAIPASRPQRGRARPRSSRCSASSASCTRWSPTRGASSAPRRSRSTSASLRRSRPQPSPSSHSAPSRRCARISR